MPTRKQTIALIAAVPLAIAGWAAFRPELLFVNQTVSEKLPVTTSGAANIIASGTFESYAHETKGTAQLVSAEGKTFVNLKDFHTSNGPDVHVYLVKAGDGTPDAVNKNGFIDLGSIKGNIGDQHYEIPGGTDLSQYRGVSIWCKRFFVGFGGAALKDPAPADSGKRRTSLQVSSQLIGLPATITVTSGKVQGTSSFAGKAAIIEVDSKRYLQTDFSKAAAGNFELRLVKKETLGVGPFPKDTPFEALGAPKKGKSKVGISKSLDAWLYRSVAIVDTKANKVVGFVLLRSEQEQKHTSIDSFLNLA